MMVLAANYFMIAVMASSNPQKQLHCQDFSNRN
jgi:hypothetical protein